MKIKNLKPSHREDKRYILIKGKDANKKSVEETILEFIGVLGYAETCPQFLKGKNNEMILVVNRGSVDKIRTSFLMSKKDLQIIRVSGTIKKLGK